MSRQDRNVNIDIVGVAKILYQGRPMGYQGRDDFRIGNSGSISIKPSTGEWYDHESERGGGVREMVEHVTSRPALEWLEQFGFMAPPHRKQPRRLIASYVYRDVDGKEQYTVDKYSLGDARKTFKQHRPDPEHPGRRLNNLDGVERLPYRAPELREAIANGDLVVITEGEKDADNLARLGICATTNSEGAGKWRTELGQYFKGARVVILSDNDPSGRKHAAHIAKSLSGIAAEIHILDIAEHWPECPPKGDISDWLLKAGGTREQFDALLAQAKRYGDDSAKSPGATPSEPPTPPNHQTKITLARGQKHRVFREAAEALAKTGVFFRRGGEVVSVVGGQVEAIDEVWLAGFLDELCEFVWLRDDQEKAGDCPDWLPRRLLRHRAKLHLRELRAVISAPTIRPDGSLITETGYDPETRLLYQPSRSYPAIPACPTMGQLKAAAAFLWKPFADFPFVDNAARSVMLTALLTAAIRPTLRRAPGFIFDAPSAATGKTLLGFSLMAFCGMEGEATSGGGDEEEVRKRLLPALRANNPVILLDNIRGIFRSAALETLLTTDIYQDRVLGTSTLLALPTTPLVLISGNNFRPAGDLWRRTLTARIDAQTENPERRSFELVPDTYCRQNRPELVATALTLLRGFVAAGSPRSSNDKLASFEDWDSRIRQAVIWLAKQNVMPDQADISDPVLVIERAKKQTPERQSLGTFLDAAQSVLGDRLWRTADLIEAVKKLKTEPIGVGEELKVLHDIVTEIAGERGEINSRRLGNWLAKFQGTPCNGLVLKMAEERRWNTAQYRIRAAGDGQLRAAA